MFSVKDVDILELDEEDFDVIIADDIKFAGSIKFKKPMMIRGMIKGSIEGSSDLVIDNSAGITADISADRVLIKGNVVGNVYGEKIVHIASTGSVMGDITTSHIVAEYGSYFSGKCTMVNS